MKYLVDANVLCEATKPSPNPRVLTWLDRHEADLVVNPVILGEIRFGILLLPTGQKRRRLERWFQEGLAGLPCLPWDLPTGFRWAELLAQLRQTGRSMPVKDSLIAATALVHDLHVASRNRQDFAKTGVDLVNPFLA
ncbi:MAG: type II toxin-antitoxin system VapC family toxin [Verrucomicrobia bacterium]|jgi:predicted nucleic acid-binding protein|nr:type II toxin-antitoxin system VapC family toxin [Verrucomicrobiota bacterium]